MRALYLSYDGMTDQLGQSQVIPYLQKLSDKGYQFTIISFEKKDAFKKHHTAITELLQKSNITWLPLKYHKSPPVVSSVWDYRCMLKEANRLCKSGKVDIIHCRSYLSALAGLAMKKKFHIKFIFDMRGFWADERVEGKIWNLKNPVYRYLYHYFKRQEKKLLSGADHIITLTEKARQIIRSWKLPMLPAITVIPCCADIHHFDPEKIDTNKLEMLREKLKLKSSPLILGYLGAIGTWYMLEEMLDFFKVLLRSNADARFLFVTNEPSQVIYNSVNKKGIPSHTLVITSAPRQEVPLYISLMDAAIFFIKPTFSKKASSPTKMAELLSMGIPIICNSGVGDDDEIIEKTGSGSVCNEMNDSTYADVVLHLDSLLKKNKSDLRKTAIDYFSLEMGAGRYHDVYKNLKK